MMLKALMSIADFQYYTLTALIIFSIFSSLVAIWIFRPGSKNKYETICKHALDE